MNEIATNQLKTMLSPGDFKKALRVADRAARLGAYDDELDLSSVIVGLWVGHAGEMPKSLQYGMLGMVLAIALENVREIKGEGNDDPEP